MKNYHYYFLKNKWRTASVEVESINQSQSQKGSGKTAWWTRDGGRGDEEKCTGPVN